MVNNYKIKEYEPKYCTDERGEFYSIPISYKDEIIAVSIDIADFERFSEHNWSVLTTRGVPTYISRFLPQDGKGKRTRQQLHQFILGVQQSTPLDHIDGNGFDCRSDNLRVATPAQNAGNSKKRTKSSSIYKGVCWKKRIKRWVAQIKYQYKSIYLGSFPKEIVNGTDIGQRKAARCYDKAAIKYFGTFALLNLPEERNIVTTLKGGIYRSSHLFNERETKGIEYRIRQLQKLGSKERLEILQAMDLKDIVDMCHYFGCGIDELTNEIRKGIVIAKKNA